MASRATANGRAGSGSGPPRAPSRRAAPRWQAAGLRMAVRAGAGDPRGPVLSGLRAAAGAGRMTVTAATLGTGLTIYAVHRYRTRAQRWARRRAGARRGWIR